MMVKYIFAIGLLCCFCLSAKAQTTDEEYLYVTYGYKEQLLKGLDDKEGYAWKPLSEFQFSYNSGNIIRKKYASGKFEFEGLFRDGEEKPCAIVAIYKEKAEMAKKDGVFLCIPHAESDQSVTGKARDYFEEEVEFDEDLLNYYSQALHKLAMTLAVSS